MALSSLVRRNFFRGFENVRVAKNCASSSSLGGPSPEILEKATVRPTILRDYLDATLRHSDYFNFESKIKIEDMMNARVHYGHKVGTLNEKMRWSLFGERLGVCIFDLAQTRRALIRALNFVAHVAMRGGIFLFITSDRNSMLMVEKRVLAAGEYAHVRKWQEGTLLNSTALFGAPARLPDTIILLSALTTVLETHPSVVEATKMVIPTVAVVDSNAEPDLITYPVPGNDDSIPSIEYFLDNFLKAIKLGKEAREKLSLEQESVESST